MAAPVKCDKITGKSPGSPEGAGVAWPGEEFERLHVRPMPGRALVCGSKLFLGRLDRRRQFADAVGVDMQEGEGVDLVHNLELSLPGKFAHIDCVSVLEHCRRPWLVGENLGAALLPGGTIFVAAPFVWRRHAYPDDYYRYTAEGIRALFPDIDWFVMQYGHWELQEISGKVPPLKKINGYPMLARTEVFGFGRLA